MSEKKQLTAKKRTRDVSEVEMVQTGDSRMFSQPPAESSSGFAQPKGIQTRKAIANHLAKKQKTNGKDSGKAKDGQNQQMEDDEQEDRNGIQYWQQLIQASRQTAVVEKEARKKRLTSDQFLARQMTVKQSVNQLIGENKAMKSQLKMQKLQHSKIDLSSDDETSKETEQSVFSERLDTHELAEMIAQQKFVKSQNKRAESSHSEDEYKWKLSVVKNRRARQIWEIFIILIALYSVLVIPIRIGINDNLMDPAYDIIDLITWLIYVSDCFVNLRTTYIDNFGHEVVDSKLIAKKYAMSMRFYIDILSLVNLPNLMIKGASKSSTIILNFLGLLKLSRYFRAQRLIVQSRLRKDYKAQASCCYYFVLLLIYLHMMGCLFFLACMTTYEMSSFKLSYLEDLTLVNISTDNNGNVQITSDFSSKYVDEYTSAQKEIAAKQIHPEFQPVVHGWVPAYDNYDGAEKFWRMYELSRLDEEQLALLEKREVLTNLDRDNGNWAYIWAVSIYYSVLVIGGNEMQPAQEIELLWVVVMNISGLIFMTWIVGEIAVLVAQLSIKSSGLQQEIDIVNTAMKNAKLSQDLQNEIRDYFLKVQGTMGQQEELTNFFQLISDPMRIAVQRELFTNVLREKNHTIADTIKAIVNDKGEDVSGAGMGADDEEQDQSASEARKKTMDFTQQVSERMDGFLPSIVERLDTSLQLPHAAVINQGEEDDRCLYFVGKGDCKVTVRNARGKEVIVQKLLEGHHFGEIGMIYGCERTATVYSMNYNTFAVMKPPLYRRLVQDYPEYEACLKRHLVKTYTDHRVKFLSNMVKRVEYLDQVPVEILFDLIFSLKSKPFPKSESVLGAGENIEEIFFIEEGQVEVSTEFEGNKFVIDVLGPGSVINYRSVFLKDQMYVDLTAISDVKMLTLHLDTLMALVNKHGETSNRNQSEAEVRAQKQRIQLFSTRVLIAQNRYLKGERSFPVDYLRNDYKVKETAEMLEQTTRRNLLKNVVMRIVLATRERKKRPKLQEVMEVYRKQKHEPDAKVKFQEKFRKLYSQEEVIDEDEKDEKYMQLISTMTRIKQQLGSQQMALNGLVMKVNNLIERKNKREAIRAGKVVANNLMEDSEQSKFTAGSKKSGRSNQRSVRNKSAARGKAEKSLTLLPETLPDDTDEDLNFEEKEKLERSKLKEIDSMYLINQEEDDELFLFRGMNKQKQKNNEVFAPLKSPYINLGQDSAAKSEGSATDSRNSSTVMEIAHESESENGQSRAPVPIDEGLYEELDELDRDQQ